MFGKRKITKRSQKIVGLDSNKIPYPDSPKVKCTKCGYEFECDPGWLKATTTIGCPKCGAWIKIPKPAVK